MNNIKIAKKKPIEIEVIQITGTDENIKEIQNFCGRLIPSKVSTLKLLSLLSSNINSMCPPRLNDQRPQKFCNKYQAIATPR
jgi:hypothetical protein